MESELKCIKEEEGGEGGGGGGGEKKTKYKSPNQTTLLSQLEGT